MRALAADAILAVHFLFVLFVVGGLAATWVGAALGRGWARNLVADPGAPPRRASLNAKDPARRLDISAALRHRPSPRPGQQPPRPT